LNGIARLQRASNLQSCTIWAANTAAQLVNKVRGPRCGAIKLSSEAAWLLTGGCRVAQLLRLSQSYVLDLRCGHMDIYNQISNTSITCARRFDYPAQNPGFEAFTV